MMQTQIGKQAGLAWLTFLIPLAIIALAAGVFLWFAAADREEDLPLPVGPKTLEVGRDYYVMVRTVELYPVRPGGETAWDRVDGSGPDIQFSLTWQGNEVFKSSKKSDTLIGAWDAISIDVKSAILEGRVDLASSIDAAIIRVEEDTEVLLEVWDSDVAGSDAAGAFAMKLDAFELGDNTFTFEPSEENAIKRVVVRVMDKGLPVKELVEEATRP